MAIFGSFVWRGRERLFGGSVHEVLTVAKRSFLSVRKSMDLPRKGIAFT